MKKQTKVLLLLLIVLSVLTACKKNEAAPLTAYTLGESEEDAVPALDMVLGPGEALLYSVDEPTDEAVAMGLEISHTYHYRQIADPAILAAKYVAYLRQEEQGLTLLDEENHEVEGQPDMSTLYGTVILGKAAVSTGVEGEEKRIVRVVVGWSEYALAVQVAYVKGTILPPVKPPVEEDPNDPEGGGGDGSGKENAKPQASSIAQQIEYFSSLPPEQLGLEGESMSDYMVFPQEGWVKVDDLECRQIRVYRLDNKTATHELVGTYYLSRDLAKVYRETEEGQIMLLET